MRIWGLMLATLAVLAAPPSAARAQPAKSMGIDPILGCRAIADPKERLACFDGEAALLASAQASGELAVVEAAKVRELEKESFGFTLPSLPRIAPAIFGADVEVPKERTNLMEFEIARMSKGERPIFTMSNGQVWRQTEVRAVRQIKPGAQVRIRKAAMGSFLMSAKAGGEAVRVRREE